MPGRERMSARARTVALILAGIVAGSLLGGPAVAHTGRKVGHLVNRHLVNFFYTEAEADGRFINSNEKASDSNLLDGIDSSGFLKVAGKAADADLLDGVNSTGFLPVAGKAADSNLLDNIDSTAFLQSASTLSGVFSCPGAGFLSEVGGATTTGADGVRKTGLPDSVRCAVHVPNGATVTAVTFTLLDDSAANSVTCSLTRTDIVSPVIAEDTAAGPTATAVDTGVATTLSPALVAGKTVIANASFGYSLECALDGTVDTGVYGAVITYTVPASVG